MIRVIGTIALAIFFTGCNQVRPAYNLEDVCLKDLDVKECKITIEIKR